MIKDLVIINKDDNKENSNSNNEFNSNSRVNINSLSKKDSNKVDYGESPFGNPNDDYDNGFEYPDGNYDDYDNDDNDDSTDYYSGGNVYQTDFNEDYPEINNSAINKLYEDIKKQYESNGKEEEEKEEDLQTLPLNDKTSAKFFNIIKDEIELESGKIIFKSYSFDSLNPKIKNKEKDYFFIFLLLLFIIIITMHQVIIAFALLFLLIGVFVFFIMVVYRLIKYLIESFSESSLVLDYWRNAFYLNSKSFFKNNNKFLFDFDDILDIGVSSEKKDSNYTYKILFLLKNGEAFCFKESKIDSVDTLAYYSKIAKNLSYAVKKHYFDNTNKQKLYRSVDGNNQFCFTTRSDLSEELIPFEGKQI